MEQTKKFVYNRW